MNEPKQITALEEALEIAAKAQRGEAVSTVLLNMAHAVVMRHNAKLEEERNAD